jgi:uncharacterized membrane protein
MLFRKNLLILALAGIGLLISTPKVFSISQVEYDMQIFDSGLASWTISMTVTVNDTYDDLNQFQNKVRLLVEAASNSIGRNMSAQAVSLNSIISGSYIALEYVFRWYNFSKVENGTIFVGDVFQIHNLFPSLYGDGTVRMTYPSGYEAEQMLPPPSLRDDSLRLLEWLGSAEFDSGNVNITFRTPGGPSGSFLGSLDQNAIIVGAVTAALAVSATGILVFRRQRTRRTAHIESPLPMTPTGLENDEEKVVKMLKSIGGSTYQSVLTEQFRFSRSKTSQLLSAMERNGIIKRQRRGRDKIVTLIKKDGEKGS